MHRETPTLDTTFWLIAIAVLVLCFFTMPAEQLRGDALAIRCDTVTLLNTGHLGVPREVALQFGERGKYFFENVEKERWFPVWGILNSLIYVPALAIEKALAPSLPYTQSNLRVLMVNFTNLGFTFLTTLYLYLLCRLYVRPAAAVLFIVSALFCTFWWYYLRAQNSEIYQTLFVLGLFYHCVQWMRAVAALCERRTASDKQASSTVIDRRYSPATRHAAVAGLFIILLVLTKPTYLFWTPALLAIPFFGRQASNLSGKTDFPPVEGTEMQAGSPFAMTAWKAVFRPDYLLIAGSVAVAFLLLLASNYYRYGSPLETGYSQFYQDTWSGKLFFSLKGYLFSLQHSILVLFPLIVFATFGYRSFARQHLSEFVLLIAFSLIQILVHAKFWNPFGEWCYGPRYLLPICPLLSLPCLYTYECMINNFRRVQAILLGLILITTLAISLRLQCKVNALPFFVFYDAGLGLLRQVKAPEVDEYFDHHHFGTINTDLLAFKDGKPFPLIETLRPKLGARNSQLFETALRRVVRSNYYFFPDRRDGTEPR